MDKSFEKNYLDAVYYIDFYSIEKYGKTKLGNLIFYGKQNEDKSILKMILEIIRTPIERMIHQKKIDAYAFIPPSIKRRLQILDEIKKGLALPLNECKLLKIFKEKIVSQKSLNKKEERIINARDTIFLGNRDFRCHTLLLIDDAVGSGATLNETAKKVKQLSIAKKVIGIAIVGSYK